MTGRSPEDEQAWRLRQRGRNRVVGLVLGGFAVLFFAITIVKLALNVQ